MFQSNTSVGEFKQANVGLANYANIMNGYGIRLLYWILRLCVIYCCNFQLLVDMAFAVQVAVLVLVPVHADLHALTTRTLSTWSLAQLRDTANRLLLHNNNTKMTQSTHTCQH